MKKRLTITMIVVSLLWVGNVLALPVQFDIGNTSYIDVSDTTNGLIMWANTYDSVQNESFSLNKGQSYTFKFSMLGTTEDKVNNDDKVPQTVTAWLDFDLPTDSNENVEGTTVGFSAGLNFLQGWEVTWEDPVTVALSNGIMFDIMLSDTGFKSGFWNGPDGFCGNAYAEVYATVKLISEAAPVPEPATLFLLGSGLASLAFYRRKQIK